MKPTNENPQSHQPCPRDICFSRWNETNSCLDKSRPTPVSWLLLSSLSAALREVHLPGSLHQLSQHHPVFWPPWQQLGHAVSKGWVRNSACCVSLWLPQGSIFSLVKIKHRIYHIFLQSGLANMSRDCGKKSSLFLSKTLKIIYLFIHIVAALTHHSMHTPCATRM